MRNVKNEQISIPLLHLLLICFIINLFKICNDVVVTLTLSEGREQNTGVIQYKNELQTHVKMK